MITGGEPGEAPAKRARTSSSCRAAAPDGGGGVELGNPRIVRASSRAPGGKDRHSKVATVRGLRDRRVRLSVPTAVQLYDLQDRLGLGQPSKVVDWLLHAARHAIDRLPPLPTTLPLDVSHFSTAAGCDRAATREQRRRRLVDVGINGQRAYFGQWDPLDTTAHASYTGGGHPLQPQASCSTTSLAPTFDQAFGSYGYNDHGGGGSRDFVPPLQEY